MPSRPRHKHRPTPTLEEQFPPSAPCSCQACLAYCRRPGWWTVAEAERAIQAGYADRMMLELSPDRHFGVLSPAFRGCEANLALQAFADRGCTFLRDGLCDLFGSGVQPLECRFCHHDRPGLGPRCHAAIQADWQTPAGRQLVAAWGRLSGLQARLGLLGR